MTKPKSFVRAGRNVWRVERADRFALIVDADDYFRHARAAMLSARKRIMLVGWDFDARIDLGEGDGRRPDAPTTVGDLIYWLVEQNPDLNVYLLRWDLGAIKTLFRGSTVFTLAKWMRHPRIHTKLDGCHPTGASHHQKIVVIDDRMAFCGGIDMTADRWDTRSHRDDDPGRRRPTTGRKYGPWHDATSALDGPVAAALGEHCRERWRRSGAGALRPVTGGAAHWPDGLEPDFTDVEVGIARTWPDWANYPAVDEIEKLYVDMIAAAKTTIYAESQYFASRAIAQALCKRLEEEDGPEIVIVNPERADGWLEQQAMDTARERLVEHLRRTRFGKERFRIYHPVTTGGEPIYVHAKILIIDDRAIRVGSSNFNNRSLGLDSECDVVIDTERAGNAACTVRIAAIRDDLLAEHLGTTPAKVGKAIAAKGIVGAVESLRGKGRTLVPYEQRDLAEVSEWLADNEVLDPVGPGAAFEDLGKRNLVRRIAHRLRHRRSR